MKNKRSPHQDYYDRKLARAEETTVLLAKVTLVLLPLILIGQIVYWIWF